MSSPAWGTWIEIYDGTAIYVGYTSSPAWGTWIEIPAVGYTGLVEPCRPPLGGRGLKFEKICWLLLMN